MINCLIKNRIAVFTTLIVLSLQMLGTRAGAWSGMPRGLSTEELSAVFGGAGTEKVAPYFLGGTEMWVDGEVLRHYFSSLREGIHPKITEVVDRLDGAHLKRERDHLVVSVFSSTAATLRLKEEKQAKRMELYQIDVPRSIRLRLSNQGGILRLWGLDGRDELGKRFRFRVRIPVVSDKVYLRELVVDLVNGEFAVEVGALGNGVTLIATGNALERRWDGIDWAESLLRNFFEAWVSPVYFQERKSGLSLPNQKLPDQTYQGRVVNE